MIGVIRLPRRKKVDAMVSKMYTVDDIIKLLAAQGYFANRKIAYSVLNALQPDSARS